MTVGKSLLLCSNDVIEMVNQPVVISIKDVVNRFNLMRMNPFNLLIG